MSHEILMSENDGILRVAQIENGKLIALQAAPLSDEVQAAQTGIGHIYLGRVENVVGRLQAGFIDIGLERAGFMSARDARALAENDASETASETPIEECIADNDTVLVQVNKVPRGDKGAQVSADITLPGRAMVLSPCRTRIAVSRTIEDEAERQRLADLVADICATQGDNGVMVEGNNGAAGWVIRTAAIGMQRDDLLADMQNIASQWRDLLARAQSAEPPLLLHADLAPVARALRDLVRPDTQMVVIEGAASLQQARDYCQTHLPALAPLVQSSAGDEHLFDRHDVAAQLEAALSPRLALPSGGWLMIETTEAMTTIDVNSGSDSRGILATNLEAAAMIGHQLRLRALGGLIAVDFIDMTAMGEKEQVTQALNASFADDKNAVRVGSMSEFCVVELTRRRDGVTLAHALQNGGAQN